MILYSGTIKAMKKEIAVLREELIEVKSRLNVAESNSDHMRIGEVDWLALQYSRLKYKDRRPTISIHSAINAILDHLGLEFKATEEKAATVFIGKVDKKK